MPPGMLALLAVQETGSITAAAARCHVTQPALSRQIQSLAGQVGVALVRRQGRTAVLTDAGRDLAACAARQRADWEATLATLRGRPHPPLRLGCGTTLALSLLPSALARLHAAEPAQGFLIAAGDSATTAARLLRGEIDAGLVTTASGHPRLQAEPILVDPVVVVARPGGPARISLGELAAGPLCLYARGTGFRQFIDELFAAAGLHPEPTAEMDSMEALRELVAAGLGRSLLPRSVLAPALAAGRVAVVSVSGLPAASRTVALLHRSDRAPHPALARLREALLAAAGPG